MDIRAQVSMVFHLDKCIGCHTCSIACKNIWTDRKGTEYMWWNNVETKPGTGYPTTWENQDKYKGGWVKDGDRLRLRLQGKWEDLGNIFFNPNLPTIDDYYEPGPIDYHELFNAPEGDDQPTARPISLITGKPMDTSRRDRTGTTTWAARRLREQRRQLRRAYRPRAANSSTKSNSTSSSTCPASATTASTRAAWLRARPARSTSAAKTASC